MTIDNRSMAGYQPVFIIGSPRSGTTLTGRILASHPRTSTFFVPYFVWERDFTNRTDDRLTCDDASESTAVRIRREFARFARHQGADYVIDQSPRNSLRVEFVRAVFPNARFIHVLRDGRDAALSIYAQWLSRRQAFSDAYFRPRLILRSLEEHLRAQPLLRHKLAALWFELGGLKGPYSRRRWLGITGWGPRFPGWRNAYSRLDLLSFAAEQWRICNETAAMDLGLAPRGNTLTIYYEDLLRDQNEVLRDLLDFLGLEETPAFRANLPTIRMDNTGKWKKRLSEDEADALTVRLRGALERWGYPAE